MVRRSGLIQTVQGRRGQRRKTGWGIGPGGSTGEVTSSAVGSALIGTGAQSTADGQTVVRIRGELMMYLQSASAAGDGMRGAVGIGIAESIAFAAGIGSLNTPITEEGAENWLWHTYFALETAGATETWGTGPNVALRIAIDSKAMRKFDANRTLYAAVEIEVEEGTAVVRTFLNSRALVKLA